MIQSNNTENCSSTSSRRNKVSVIWTVILSICLISLSGITFVIPSVPNFGLILLESLTSCNDHDLSLFSSFIAVKRENNNSNNNNKNSVAYSYFFSNFFVEASEIPRSQQQQQEKNSGKKILNNKNIKNQAKSSSSSSTMTPKNDTFWQSHLPIKMLPQQFIDLTKDNSNNNNNDKKQDRRQRFGGVSISPTHVSFENPTSSAATTKNSKSNIPGQTAATTERSVFQSTLFPEVIFLNFSRHSHNNNSGNDKGEYIITHLLGFTTSDPLTVSIQEVYSRQRAHHSHSPFDDDNNNENDVVPFKFEFRYHEQTTSQMKDINNNKNTSPIFAQMHFLRIYTATNQHEPIKIILQIRRPPASSQEIVPSFLDARPLIRSNSNNNNNNRHPSLRPQEVASIPIRLNNPFHGVAYTILDVEIVPATPTIDELNQDFDFPQKSLRTTKSFANRKIRRDRINALIEASLSFPARSDHTNLHDHVVNSHLLRFTEHQRLDPESRPSAPLGGDGTTHGPVDFELLFNARSWENHATANLNELFGVAHLVRDSEMWQNDAFSELGHTTKRSVGLRDVDPWTLKNRSWSTAIATINIKNPAPRRGFGDSGAYPKYFSGHVRIAYSKNPISSAQPQYHAYRRWIALTQQLFNTSFTEFEEPDPPARNRFANPEETLQNKFDSSTTSFLGIEEIMIGFNISFETPEKISDDDDENEDHQKHQEADPSFRFSSTTPPHNFINDNEGLFAKVIEGERVFPREFLATSSSASTKKEQRRKSSSSNNHNNNKKKHQQPTRKIVDLGSITNPAHSITKIISYTNENDDVSLALRELSLLRGAGNDTIFRNRRFVFSQKSSQEEADDDHDQTHHDPSRWIDIDEDDDFYSPLVGMLDKKRRKNKVTTTSIAFGGFDAVLLEQEKEERREKTIAISSNRKNKGSDKQTIFTKGCVEVQMLQSSPSTIVVPPKSTIEIARITVFGRACWRQKPKDFTSATADIDKHPQMPLGRYFGTISATFDTLYPEYTTSEGNNNHNRDADDDDNVLLHRNNQQISSSVLDRISQLNKNRLRPHLRHQHMLFSFDSVPLLCAITTTAPDQPTSLQHYSSSNNKIPGSASSTSVSDGYIQTMSFALPSSSSTSSSSRKTIKQLLADHRVTTHFLPRNSYLLEKQLFSNNHHSADSTKNTNNKKNSKNNNNNKDYIWLERVSFESPWIKYSPPKLQAARAHQHQQGSGVATSLFLDSGVFGIRHATNNRVAKVNKTRAKDRCYHSYLSASDVRDPIISTTAQLVIRVDFPNRAGSAILTFSLPIVVFVRPVVPVLESSLTFQQRTYPFASGNNHEIMMMTELMRRNSRGEDGNNNDNPYYYDENGKFRKKVASSPFISTSARLQYTNFLIASYIFFSTSPISVSSTATSIEMQQSLNLLKLFNPEVRHFFLQDAFITSRPSLNSFAVSPTTASSFVDSDDINNNNNINNIYLSSSSTSVPTWNSLKTQKGMDKFVRQSTKNNNNNNNNNNMDFVELHGGEVHIPLLEPSRVLFPAGIASTSQHNQHQQQQIHFGLVRFQDFSSRVVRKLYPKIQHPSEYPVSHLSAKRMNIHLVNPHNFSIRVTEASISETIRETTSTSLNPVVPVKHQGVRFRREFVNQYRLRESWGGKFLNAAPTSSSKKKTSQNGNNNKKSSSLSKKKNSNSNKNKNAADESKQRNVGVLLRQGESLILPLEVVVPIKDTPVVGHFTGSISITAQFLVTNNKKNEDDDDDDEGENDETITNNNAENLVDPTKHDIILSLCYGLTFDTDSYIDVVPVPFTIEEKQLFSRATSLSSSSSSSSSSQHGGQNNNNNNNFGRRPTAADLLSEEEHQNGMIMPKGIRFPLPLASSSSSTHEESYDQENSDKKKSSSSKQQSLRHEVSLYSVRRKFTLRSTISFDLPLTGIFVSFIDLGHLADDRASITYIERDDLFGNKQKDKNQKSSSSSSSSSKTSFDDLFDESRVLTELIESSGPNVTTFHRRHESFETLIRREYTDGRGVVVPRNLIDDKSKPFIEVRFSAASSNSVSSSSPSSSPPLVQHHHHLPQPAENLDPISALLEKHLSPYEVSLQSMMMDGHQHQRHNQPKSSSSSPSSSSSILSNQHSMMVIDWDSTAPNLVDPRTLYQYSTLVGRAFRKEHARLVLQYGPLTSWSIPIVGERGVPRFFLGSSTGSAFTSQSSSVLLLGTYPHQEPAASETTSQQPHQNPASAVLESQYFELYNPLPVPVKIQPVLLSNLKLRTNPASSSTSKNTGEENDNFEYDQHFWDIFFSKQQQGQISKNPTKELRSVMQKVANLFDARWKRNSFGSSSDSLSSSLLRSAWSTPSDLFSLKQSRINNNKTNPNNNNNNDNLLQNTGPIVVLRPGERRKIGPIDLVSFNSVFSQHQQQHHPHHSTANSPPGTCKPHASTNVVPSAIHNVLLLRNNVTIFEHVYVVAACGDPLVKLMTSSLSEMNNNNNLDKKSSSARNKHERQQHQSHILSDFTIHFDNETALRYVKNIEDDSNNNRQATSPSMFSFEVVKRFLSWMMLKTNSPPASHSTNNQDESSNFSSPLTFKDLWTSLISTSSAHENFKNTDSPSVVKQFSILNEGVFPIKITSLYAVTLENYKNAEPREKQFRSSRQLFNPCSIHSTTESRNKLIHSAGSASVGIVTATPCVHYLNNFALRNSSSSNLFPNHIIIQPRASLQINITFYPSFKKEIDDGYLVLTQESISNTNNINNNNNNNNNNIQDVASIVSKNRQSQRIAVRAALAASTFASSYQTNLLASAVLYTFGEWVIFYCSFFLVSVALTIVICWSRVLWVPSLPLLSNKTKEKILEFRFSKIFKKTQQPQNHHPHPHLHHTKNPQEKPPIVVISNPVVVAKKNPPLSTVVTGKKTTPSNNTTIPLPNKKPQNNNITNSQKKPLPGDDATTARLNRSTSQDQISTPQIELTEQNDEEAEEREQNESKNDSSIDKNEENIAKNEDQQQQDEIAGIERPTTDVRTLTFEVETKNEQDENVDVVEITEPATIEKTVDEPKSPVTAVEQGKNDEEDIKNKNNNNNDIAVPTTPKRTTPARASTTPPPPQHVEPENTKQTLVKNNNKTETMTTTSSNNHKNTNELLAPQAIQRRTRRDKEKERVKRKKEREKLLQQQQQATTSNATIKNNNTSADLPRNNPTFSATPIMSPSLVFTLSKERLELHQQQLLQEQEQDQKRKRNTNIYQNEHNKNNDDDDDDDNESNLHSLDNSSNNNNDNEMERLDNEHNQEVVVVGNSQHHIVPAIGKVLLVPGNDDSAAENQNQNNNKNDDNELVSTTIRNKNIIQDDDDDIDHGNSNANHNIVEEDEDNTNTTKEQSHDEQQEQLQQQQHQHQQPMSAKNRRKLKYAGLPPLPSDEERREMLLHVGSTDFTSLMPSSVMAAAAATAAANQKALAKSNSLNTSTMSANNNNNNNNNNHYNSGEEVEVGAHNSNQNQHSSLNVSTFSNNNNNSYNGKNVIIDQTEVDTLLNHDNNNIQRTNDSPRPTHEPQQQTQQHSKPSVSPPPPPPIPPQIPLPASHQPKQQFTPPKHVNHIPATSNSLSPQQLQQQQYQQNSLRPSPASNNRNTTTTTTTTVVHHHQPQADTPATTSYYYYTNPADGLQYIVAVPNQTNNNNNEMNHATTNPNAAVILQQQQQQLQYTQQMYQIQQQPQPQPQQLVYQQYYQLSDGQLVLASFPVSNSGVNEQVQQQQHHHHHQHQQHQQPAVNNNNNNSALTSEQRMYYENYYAQLRNAQLPHQQHHVAHYHHHSHQHQMHHHLQHQLQHQVISAIINNSNNNNNNNTNPPPPPAPPVPNNNNNNNNNVKHQQKQVAPADSHRFIQVMNDHQTVQNQNVQQQQQQQQRAKSQVATASTTKKSNKNNKNESNNIQPSNTNRMAIAPAPIIPSNNELNDRFVLPSTINTTTTTITAAPTPTTTIANTKDQKKKNSKNNKNSSNSASASVPPQYDIYNRAVSSAPAPRNNDNNNNINNNNINNNVDLRLRTTTTTASALQSAVVATNSHSANQKTATKNNNNNGDDDEDDGGVADLLAQLRNNFVSTNNNNSNGLQQDNENNNTHQSDTVQNPPAVVNQPSSNQNHHQQQQQVKEGSMKFDIDALLLGW